MRNARDAVSVAMDAPALPVRALLPLSSVLLFMLRAGQLEPDQIVADMIRRGWLSEAEARQFANVSSPTSLVWGYERHPMAEIDGVALQKISERFPELAREVVEPCLDPGCDGPMAWGDVGVGTVDPITGLHSNDDHGTRRPKRTVWDLIRHLRRDHQWPLERLAARLGGR